MSDQIPRAVQEERARRAAAVATEMEKQYLSGLVGRTLPVLFETEKDGLWQGHAPNYVPVRAVGEHLHNVLCHVLVEEVDGSALIGRIVG